MHLMCKKHAWTRMAHPSCTAGWQLALRLPRAALALLLRLLRQELVSIAYNRACRQIQESARPSRAPGAGQEAGRKRTKRGSGRRPQARVRWAGKVQWGSDVTGSNGKALQMFVPAVGLQAYCVVLLRSSHLPGLMPVHEDAPPGSRCRFSGASAAASWAAAKCSSHHMPPSFVPTLQRDV